jgi:hypothetical protein
MLSWSRAAVLALPVLVFTAGSPRALNESGAQLHPAEMHRMMLGQNASPGQCKFAVCFERCLSLIGGGDFTDNRKCSMKCANHGCT